MVTWWRRSVLGSGGARTVAAMRIGLAVSALLTLARLAQWGPVALGDAAPRQMFRPVGLMLAWPGVPSTPVVTSIWWIAVAAAVAMLLGVFSRVAATACVFGVWFLTSYESAFSLPWSHGFSPVVLALIAFLGARGGDAWSVDAWRRRRRGAPAPDADGRAYRRSIVLGAFVIAFVFGSAGATKLYAGGLDLAWVLSDNLRNQIASRYATWGEPRTALAAWLIASPARWQIAAALNLLAQLAPVAGLFVLHRPGWRLLVGVVVAVEVLGLALVMNFWNQHWLPLLVVFVDWDRLADRARAWSGRAIAGGGAGPASPSPRPAWRDQVGRAHAAALVVLLLSAGLGLDQRLRLYPISSFPMYARLRVTPPYDRHLPFDVIGGRLEVTAEPPLPPGYLDALGRDLLYKKLWRARSLALVEDGLRELRARIQRELPGARLREVRLHRSAYRIPAYPAPPDPVVVDLGLVGALDEHGRFRGGP